MQTASYSIPGILSLLKIDALNEMQLAALDASRKDGDIILLADTGAGKTLGFLLPMLERIQPDNGGTQALVIVPSRELALQIEQVFKNMGTGLKVTCCYGGHKRETEENNLLEAPSLIVGTPGRLADHIRRGNIRTGSIRTLILDEFDKSLEAGFQGEISEILAAIPKIDKRILTSATEALEIPAFVNLHQPQKLNFLTGRSAPALAVEQVESPEKDKIDTLFRLICRIGSRSVIVFCNHRESVERVSELLKDKGIFNVFYHGAMEQAERDSALAKFRNGTSDVLVTTDLAARGLDIPNIRYIVHYHLPNTAETYTHRNGRTARMDASGTVILIIGPDESLPDFVDPVPPTLELPETATPPDKPKWTTLFISAGKKDKVNKVDIVGFLSNRGQLKKEDIGLIEVKDFLSYVAVRKSKLGHTMHLIKDQRIKNKKVKIEVAK
jgi:ATP-independent RNA helicase DbpA